MNKEQVDPIKDAFEEISDELAKNYKITDPVKYDKKYKRRINRLYRFVGYKKIPYPEVDNNFERLNFRIKNIRVNARTR